MYTQFLRGAEHLNGLLQFQDSKFLFGDIEQVELKIPIKKLKMIFTFKYIYQYKDNFSFCG